MLCLQRVIGGSNAAFLLLIHVYHLRTILRAVAVNQLLEVLCRLGREHGLLNIEHIAVLLLGYSLIVGTLLSRNLKVGLMVLYVGLVVLVDIQIPFRPAQRHTFLTLHDWQALSPGLVKGQILAGLESVDIGMCAEKHHIIGRELGGFLEDAWGFLLGGIEPHTAISLCRFQHSRQQQCLSHSTRNFQMRLFLGDLLLLFLLSLLLQFPVFFLLSFLPTEFILFLLLLSGSLLL